MQILFLGCLFNKDDECDLLRNSKMGLPGAVNTFQWNLIEGLEAVIGKPLDIINVLPVGTYPKSYKSIILKTKHWSHILGANNIEIGSLNIPVFKQFMRYLASKREIRDWINRYEDSNIIIYSTYLPYLRIIRRIDSSVKITLIVTDLPEYYDLADKQSVLRKMLRYINNKCIYNSLKRIDCFVILTEHMKNLLRIKDRPYVVIEGIAKESAIWPSKENSGFRKTQDIIILYAGTLHYKFGIGNLLKAFAFIDNNNYRLWICGFGEASEEITELSKADHRIEYYGYVPKKEVLELQQHATVLINPRANEGEYTKYSFPSKTMEYMASGKPVLMYKLDGVPDEYDQYLYYLSSSDPKVMAKEILEICNKPRNELADFGVQAKEFVLQNKNNVVQAGKVIEMMRTPMINNRCKEMKNENDKHI